MLYSEGGGPVFTYLMPAGFEKNMDNPIPGWTLTDLKTPQEEPFSQVLVPLLLSCKELLISTKVVIICSGCRVLSAEMRGLWIAS